MGFRRTWPSSRHPQDGGVLAQCPRHPRWELEAESGHMAEARATVGAKVGTGLHQIGVVPAAPSFPGRGLDMRPRRGQGKWLV